MRKILGALALVAFVCTGAYATQDVTEPGVPVQTDDFLDILFEFACVSDYCVGVGFDGELVWVSGGDQATGVCEFYIHDCEGNLLDTVAQGAGATGWGNRDMAWDCDYMVGSYSSAINCYSDPATFEGLFIGPINPNRALAFDGTCYYTCGFGEYLYSLVWDGVFGTVATATMIGGPWDGAYGLASDNGNDCLWMSTADYTGNLHQITHDGYHINTYALYPPYDIQGGCTMVDCGYGWVLAVLQQYAPDMITFYDVESGGTPPSAVSEGTWGSIKDLYR